MNWDWGSFGLGFVGGVLIATVLMMFVMGASGRDR
jgi:hypothetical protein